jgi:hypothetical protein
MQPTSDIGIPLERCEYCPPGKIGLGASFGLFDNISCVPCSPGRYRGRLHHNCDLCPDGRYSGGGGAECQGCSVPSTIRSQEINDEIFPQSVCETCEPGTQPSTDGSTCDLCTGNTYSNLGAQCTLCTPGTVANRLRTTCNDLGRSSEVTDPAVAVQLLSDSVVDGTPTLLPKMTLAFTVVQAALVQGSEPQKEALRLLAEEIGTAIGVQTGSIEIDALDEIDRTLDLEQEPNAFTWMVVQIVIHGADPIVSISSFVNQLHNPLGAMRASPTTTGINPNTLTFAFACQTGLYRPKGEVRCRSCTGNGIPDPNEEFERCRECPENQAPSKLGHQCRCTTGFYDASSGPIICYGVGDDWSKVDFDASETGSAGNAQCQPCGECISCSDGAAAIKKGYMVSETQKAVATRPSSRSDCSHTMFTQLQNGGKFCSSLASSS